MSKTSVYIDGNYYHQMYSFYMVVPYKRGTAKYYKVVRCIANHLTNKTWKITRNTISWGYQDRDKLLRQCDYGIALQIVTRHFSQSYVTLSFLIAHDVHIEVSAEAPNKTEEVISNGL